MTDVDQAETSAATTAAKMLPRSEAMKLTRKVFDGAVRLLRADATGGAARAVAAAAEALARANALHENPLNNGTEQYDRFAVEYIKARDAVAYTKEQRR